MKIYFAGSIRGGRKDAALYRELIAHIQTSTEVLTEHVGDRSLEGSYGETYEPRYIHDRDMRWLEEADGMIAEVSTPSLGVGYEIARAVTMKKQVLCLYHPNSGKRLSAMIKGCPDVQVVEYSGAQEAMQAVDSFLLNCAKQKGFKFE